LIEPCVDLMSHANVHFGITVLCEVAIFVSVINLLRVSDLKQYFSALTTADTNRR
jgi:hypothetical protein